MIEVNFSSACTGPHTPLPSSIFNFSKLFNYHTVLQSLFPLLVHNLLILLGCLVSPLNIKCAWRRRVRLFSSHRQGAIVSLRYEFSSKNELFFKQCLLGAQILPRNLLIAVMEAIYFSSRIEDPLFTCLEKALWIPILLRKSRVETMHDLYAGVANNLQVVQQSSSPGFSCDGGASRKCLPGNSYFG